MMKKNSSLKKSNSYQNSLCALVIWVALLTLVGLSTVQAQEYETYNGYDSIVRELTSSHADASDVKKGDAFDEIRFHVGVSLVNSSVSLRLPAPYKSDSVDMQGYEARFGIDLFSPNWVADAAIRSFDPQMYSGAEIHLREFDLLLNYHVSPKSKLDFYMGGGMAARYLNINENRAKKKFARENSTPSSVICAGFDLGLTEAFSVGLKFSYRNPLINETVDKGALDGGLQLTGHF